MHVADRTNTSATSTLTIDAQNDHEKRMSYQASVHVLHTKCYCCVPATAVPFIAVMMC